MKNIGMVAIITLLTVLSCPLLAIENALDQLLTAQMQKYEVDIQNTYLEYQKIYYEKKSSLAELRAFEDIISVYVAQILELYDTLTLSGFGEMENSRDIVARALIYRALVYLEKAPLNITYYEKACYDYYTALDMFRDVEGIPVIFKELPYELYVGNTEMNRFVDVLDKKGNEIYNFGKVQLKLRNFKITSDLNVEDLEFRQIKSGQFRNSYTYDSAEELIKKAFRDVIGKEGESTTLLALPEGSYYIRSRSNQKSQAQYMMSTIYVRANQQHEYIIEPLADWIILYENPNTRKLKFNAADKLSKNDLANKKFVSANRTIDMAKLVALEEKVNSCYEKVDVEKIFNLNDSWIKNKFSSLVADVIYSYSLSAKIYNNWSPWMTAWLIARDITQKHSPNSEVPTELIRFVYEVLKII